MRLNVLSSCNSNENTKIHTYIPIIVAMTYASSVSGLCSETLAAGFHIYLSI